MSEVEIAMSWKAFSVQNDCKNMAEAIITHSQYKSIFEGVAREAVQVSQSYIESTPSRPHIGNIGDILDKYDTLVETQIERVAR